MLSIENNLWQDEIEDEMVNVRPVLDEWETDEEKLIGCQKKEFIRWKALHVTGSYTTEILESLNYSSVLARYLDIIAFLLVAFNGLVIKARDIQNEHLKEDCSEHALQQAQSLDQRDV